MWNERFNRERQRAYYYRRVSSVTFLSQGAVEVVHSERLNFEQTASVQRVVVVVICNQLLWR